MYQMMVDLADLSEKLDAVVKASPACYVALDRPLGDPVLDAEANLAVFGGNDTEAVFALPRRELPGIASLLSMTIFGKDRGVLAWDIKPFFTYCRHHLTPRLFSLLTAPQKFMDLCPAERFLGKDHEAPDDLMEATGRYRLAAKAKAFHDRVHEPLIRTVLPTVEACGLINTETNRSVYPWYDIEGAVNGRLSCQLIGRSFNPHGLTPDEAGKLIPRAPHDLFVRLDYRAYEMGVLAWLSGDRALLDALDEPDLYGHIGQLVGWDQRETLKTAFLAVMFGQQVHGLRDAADVAYRVAQQFRLAVAHHFPMAWAWLGEAEERARAGEAVEDRFGRPRVFEEPHKVRNYLVSSPAAGIALERLVALQAALGGSARVVASVHDGYFLTCEKKQARGVIDAARACLEAQSPLAPGLRLKVAASYGYRLNQMVAV